MATVTGPMLTTNVLGDQLALDFSDTIAYLDPSAAPLTLISTLADKRRTVATSYSHFENRRAARFDTIVGINNTTVTSIIVTTGAYYAQWDLWQVTRTGEVMRVDGVSGNTLAVTRNIAPSGVGTGVATVANDEFMKVGTSQPENDTSKPARSDVPSKITNNTEIFRTPLEASNTLMASGFQITPDEWARQNKDKGIEHAIDIESAFLFGKKSLTTPGSAAARTTAGALAHITTNQTDMGGDMSEAEWNAFLATAFLGTTGGSSKKFAFASSTGVMSLNKFPASKQQTKNDETTYGMDVTTFNSPFGSVKLILHRLLKGTKYGGYIVILDTDNIAYRYLANDQMSRDTKLLTNRQPRDQDGRKDELLSEVGFQVKMQEAHAVATGITS